MITIQSKYEDSAYPQDSISMGIIYGGHENQPETHKFRGIYFKIILPWEKEKEYTDYRTYEPKVGICKHTYVFQLVKIRFEWKQLAFLKANVWVPTNQN